MIVGESVRHNPDQILRCIREGRLNEAQRWLAAAWALELGDGLALRELDVMLAIARRDPKMAKYHLEWIHSEEPDYPLQIEQILSLCETYVVKSLRRPTRILPVLTTLEERFSKLFDKTSCKMMMLIAAKSCVMARDSRTESYFRRADRHG